MPRNPLKARFKIENPSAPYRHVLTVELKQKAPTEPGAFIEILEMGITNVQVRQCRASCFVSLSELNRLVDFLDCAMQRLEGLPPVEHQEPQANSSFQTASPAPFHVGTCNACHGRFSDINEDGRCSVCVMFGSV